MILLLNTMADNKNNINEIVSDDIIMSTEDIENFRTLNANTIELIRKCTLSKELDSSWTYEPNETTAKLNKTPPFENTKVNDVLNPSCANLTSSSTQSDHFVTLPGNCSVVDENLSFGKDFIKQDSTSNENSETFLGSKRQRRDSTYENMRPSKKTKCVDSCTSSTSDLTDNKVSSLEDSVSSCQLTSNSEISFKSINSSHSFKVRKRRLKSESNLFRDMLVRSRKSTNFGKHSENSSPGGTPTPRKDRSNRRSARPKAWKIVDLCTWIGKKGYQSITGLYSEPHREPLVNNAIKEHKKEPADEIKEIRIYINEINMRQDQLKEENENLKSNMEKMMAKIEELENRIRNQCSNRQNQQSTPIPQGIPPPPPPPPPPPLPPLPSGPISKKPVRSNTIPRCGSAPSRIAAPRLAITPQDIANVKLRKTKDNPNPVRSKSTVSTQQPLVTQQMLQSTRAKLGRARPVAASTPKQQLSELEKCLLQESSVTSLYRRRVVRATFRSTEELRPRPRPYPASRCPRSPHSPRSPRSNSLPRVGLAPLNFPNCVLPT